MVDVDLVQARAILRQYGGSLQSLAAADIIDYASLDGVESTTAARLKASFALAARLRNHVEADRPRISNPSDVADYFRESMRGKKQEELHALLLDAKNRVIRNVTVSIGLLDRSPAHARGSVPRCDPA